MTTSEKTKDATRGDGGYYEITIGDETDGGQKQTSAPFADCPAEPIVLEDGRVSVVTPRPGTTDVSVTELGKWRCQSCGAIAGEHAEKGSSHCPSSRCLSRCPPTVRCST